MSTQTVNIEKQIFVLERKLKNLVNVNAPQKQIFAVNGKINKLKEMLKNSKWNDFLAR